MSELLVVGLNHTTAPLAVREKFAFAADELSHALASMCALPHVEEAALLATCNRVEVYAAVRNVHAGSIEIRRRLAEMRSVDAETLAAALYQHAGEAAIRHLFRVTCSLDSMVVGEPQIAGQVKDAYGAASAAGTVGAVLHRCMHRAFAVAKRVRNETSIGRRPVSVSTVAVDLARHVFGDLKSRRILLSGAGKMTKLAAKYLRDGGSELLVVNRSLERALEFARTMGGHARAWDEIDDCLRDVDIVITATGSATPIFAPEAVARAIRARHFRPLVFIDIAVPRDVDPRVGDLENVYVFDLDALQRALAQNLAERAREATDAEALVASEARLFVEWSRRQNVVPTIKELRDQFTRVARAEEQRLLRDLPNLTAEQRDKIRVTMDSLVNKLLHAPLTALKSDTDQAPELLDATRKLFDLRAAFDAEQPWDNLGNDVNDPTQKS